MEKGKGLGGHGMLSNRKGESINEKNPEKLNVFRGSADGFVTKIYPVGTRTPTDSARNCSATNYTTE